MNRSRPTPVALGVAVGGLALTVCAPGANDVATAAGQELAGFWLGRARPPDGQCGPRDSATGGPTGLALKGRPTLGRPRAAP